MLTRYEACGLIIPLLEHEDTNVQFFGAHTGCTAQVKIAGDTGNNFRLRGERMSWCNSQLTL
ncbi:hypothetical protein JOM56_011615 [Amanita muscaria]